MNKPTNQKELYKKTTILFGYCLFIPLLVLVAASVLLPMRTLLLYPTELRMNEVILLLFLTATTVLPPLISYIIGYRVTHAGSKTERRFNGVLFGITSYWLSAFFGLINSEVTTSIRETLNDPLATAVATWPIFATVAVMAIVAVMYARSQKQQPALLANTSYQVVLFTGLIATLASMVIITSYGFTTLSFMILLNVTITLALVGLSYVVLPAKNYNPPIVRLTIAVIAVSVGAIASSIAERLLMHLPNVFIPLTVGVIALAIYLSLARRSK